MVLHLAQQASTAHDTSAAQIHQFHETHAPVQQWRVLCLSCPLWAPSHQCPPCAPFVLPSRLMPAAGGGQGDPFLSQDG